MRYRGFESHLLRFRDALAAVPLRPRCHRGPSARAVSSANWRQLGKRSPELHFGRVEEPLGGGMALVKYESALRDRWPTEDPSAVVLNHAQYRIPGARMS